MNQGCTPGGQGPDCAVRELMTGPPARVREYLAMAVPHPGAQVFGAHLESPFVSPAQCGALDPQNLFSPDDPRAERFLEYADVLRILVLAPEHPLVSKVTAPERLEAVAAYVAETARRTSATPTPPSPPTPSAATEIIRASFSTASAMKSTTRPSPISPNRF